MLFNKIHNLRAPPVESKVERLSLEVGGPHSPKKPLKEHEGILIIQCTSLKTVHSQIPSYENLLFI